ncbi:MAG TPA: hypothetical protein RMF84_05595 [Polyangiaceae bacterium LLY-WYZ-14_1]|jgi:hypothetical protein|nr:hypothetical protein [Polyangiaceae bacterium LLY-WYZ-14_1]
MDALFSALPSSPVFWAVVALVLGAVAWALLQRLLKLALMLALGLLCLLIFFELTDTEPPDALHEARRQVEDGVAEGARKGAEAATEGVRSLGGSLRDAATRAIRETAEDDAREDGP